MLVCILGWVAAFGILFPFETGLAGGGEGAGTSVCISMLVMKLSTSVWSATGAPSWI